MPTNADIYRAFGELTPEQQQSLLDWLDELLAEPTCTCEVEAYLARSKQPVPHL